VLLICVATSTAVAQGPAGRKTGVTSLNPKHCHLRTQIRYDKLHFSYSLNGQQWHKLDQQFDVTTLSDEFCQQGCFTGAFVGICAQDLTGRRAVANFDYFEYHM